MTQEHPVHQVSDGFFTTFTGKKVSYHNPTTDMICIEDIAHSLSNICRFGGHVKHFYSVAQHSMLVAYLAPPELFLPALLHDATEAYCGDVIKPLKIIIGMNYERVESKFAALIAKKFDIDLLDFKAIKEFDKLALEIEHHALIAEKPDSEFCTIWKELFTIESLDPKQYCLKPEQASSMFTRYFNHQLNCLL